MDKSRPFAKQARKIDMEEENSRWRLIRGGIPILFVASHNYPHLRQGMLKKNEPGTEELVRLLCLKTNAWGIIAGSIQKDPNWYKSSPLRREVKRIIKGNKIGVVFDIHGRGGDARDLMVFYPNEKFKGKFSICLKDLVVKKFLNDKQLTIIEDLNLLSVAGVEVEISRDGRIFPGKNSEIVISTLKQMVACLKKLI